MVNLLHPDHLRALRIEVIVRFVERILKVLFTGVVAVTIVLLLTRSAIEQRFHRVVSETSLVLRTHEQTFRGIRELNRIVAALDDAHVRVTPWSILLLALGDAAPPGIRFREVGIDQEGRLRLRGHADHREDLLLFERAVRGLATVRDPTIPFEAFLRQTDINFTLAATIDRTRIDLSRP